MTGEAKWHGWRDDCGDVTYQLNIGEGGAARLVSFTGGFECAPLWVAVAANPAVGIDVADAETGRRFLTALLDVPDLPLPEVELVLKAEGMPAAGEDPPFILLTTRPGWEPATLSMHDAVALLDSLKRAIAVARGEVI